MAIDYGPMNIRVNSINPGDTDTAMLRDEGRQTGMVEKGDAKMDDYLEDWRNQQTACKNRYAGGYRQRRSVPCAATWQAG
ncbi:MAG: hypothetical protein ACLUD2_20235 [Clostridium sp.]